MAETAPAAPSPETLGPRQRALTLTATILASALAFIDGTVVTIAIPAIQQTLDAEFGQLQWVVNAYTLTLGALLLVGGGLGDRIGRRKVFIAGIILFTVASLVCALAPNVTLLIAARAIQGVGAALLVPQSLAIISATFPREVRGRAIGTWAAASAITTSLGPPLGGFMIDTLSWRAAFWVNLPLAAIALWLTITAVPESRNEGAKGRLDWLGSVIAVAAFGALTYGFTDLPERGFGDLLVWGSLLLGALGLVLFVWVEARADDAVMPLELFRSRTFSGANIYTVFLYGCFAAVLFLLPFDLIERRGLTAAEAGFTLMPVGIVISIFSRYAGSLADKHPPGPFMIVGAGVVTLACILFALTLEDYWLGIVVPLLVLAGGMSILISPLTTAVMNAIPESRSGAASGVNNAASRIAGLLAVAILGAVSSALFMANAGAAGERFGVLPETTDPAYPVVEQAFVGALSASMWIAAAWAALAAISAWVFIGMHSEGAGPTSRPKG
jgi:EmrB/QacA subfamily drug resistance transporter